MDDLSAAEVEEEERENLAEPDVVRLDEIARPRDVVAQERRPALAVASGPVPSPGQGGKLLAGGQVFDHEVASRARTERSVGRSVTTRRSIEPARIQARCRIVNGFRADGVLATPAATR